MAGQNENPLHSNAHTSRHDSQVSQVPESHDSPVSQAPASHNSRSKMRKNFGRMQKFVLTSIFDLKFLHVVNNYMACNLSKFQIDSIKIEVCRTIKRKNLLRIKIFMLISFFELFYLKFLHVVDNYNACKL